MGFGLKLEQVERIAPKEPIQSLQLPSSRLRVNALSSFLRKLIPARYRPIGYLLHLTRTRTNRCIRHGPFAGMRFVNDAVGSAYIPKLLGTYENELVAQVERICSLKPDLIIDIGAAEGY